MAFEDTVTEPGRRSQGSSGGIYALNQHLVNGTVYPIDQDPQVQELSSGMRNNFTVIPPDPLGKFLLPVPVTLSSFD